MYVANTHLKPVIGIDIHFVNEPFPFIPIPHPFIGLVIDPFDYIPFIGATVKVNHVPRGNTDTMGLLITFIHIPLGLGFTLPPLVGHDCQNFFGSKRVMIDGAPMSGAGYLLMSCSDIGLPLSFRPGKKFKPIPSLYLPTSFCIPLQWGKPVMVGGPLVPNFSLMALLKAFVFGCFLKILGKAAGKMLKALNNKLLKKFPSTKKLTNALCKMGFEPVDLVTGRVNYEYTDFELPGPLPVKWTRIWDSDSFISGPLGHGVQLNYDRCVQLWPEEGCLSVTLQDGRMAVFPLLYHGESFYHPQEKMLLRRKQNGHFLLEDYNESQYYHFNHDTQPGKWRLSFIENYSGNRIQLHYAGLYLCAITDSVGRQLLFQLDSQHRIARVEVSYRETRQTLVSYQYNEDGDMISIADALNQATEISYRDHLMVKKTDRNGQSFYWEYDALKRCTHTWGDGGVLEGFIEYGKGFNTITNSLGEISTLFYDENNLIVQETDHYGNHRYTEYSENLEIYRRIDEEGNITGFVYDDRNRLTEKVFPDGSSEQYQYNDHNQLILLTGADGVSQTFGYDDMHRLRFINFPSGRTITYEYNADGQIETVIEGNHKTLMGYDEDDNLVKMQLPDGSMAYWKYDALGRCIQTTNAEGQVRFFEYDALSRVRNMHLPDGNVVQLQYGGYDKITRAADRHYEVQYEYTAIGHLKKLKKNNTELRFMYDAQERLHTVINAAGRHFSLEYNKRGEIIGETGFDGLRRQYERSASGKVTRLIRPGGRYTQMEYDANGRIIKIAYHDGSWELFSYDKTGKPVEATNEHGTVRFSYNKEGLLITEDQNGYQVHNTYDKFRNRIRITSSLGADIQLQRNNMKRVAQMQVTGRSPDGSTAGWQAQMQYNEAGREINRILPGALTSEWQYDQAGRPGEHKISRGGVAQAWKKYTWDANERLANVFDALSQTNTRFRHDSLGNLVFAQYASNDMVHRHADETGNLYATAEKNDRRYNAAGALQESRKYQYVYDVEGNLICKTDKTNASKTSYEWYANGLLKKVIRPDGKIVEFTYDALGRRTGKCFDGKITRWVWDNETPLHEWTYAETEKPRALVNEWGEIQFDKEEPHPANSPNIHSITWIFEADRFVPAAKIENGQTYSIISDHLGTPQWMFDAAGKKVWEGVLDIYGRIRTLQGDRSSLPFRYPGQYEDVETGLYYNRYRYYNPEEAVYISQDPIRIDSQELNFYAYVHDPNILTDIFGLTDRFPNWMDTRQGYQRQHILPYSLREHPVFTQSGMSINGASNMMYLPVVRGIDPNPLKGLHRGWTVEHSQYNQMVKDMMDDLHVQSIAERWDYRRTQQEVLALQRHLREGFHNGTYTCAS